MQQKDDAGKVIRSIVLRIYYYVIIHAATNGRRKFILRWTRAFSRKKSRERGWLRS